MNYPSFISRLFKPNAPAFTFVPPPSHARLFSKASPRRVVLLGERFERRTGVALVIGFAGMLMIAGGRAGTVGYSAEAWFGVAAAVVSALAYGLTIVLLRARATRDPLPTIVLSQNLGPTLLLAIPAAYKWAPMTASDLGLFALIGVVGVGGHLLLALAFAGAESARLAPITYVSLAWGTLFGYLFFSELPGLMALGGAALIVVGTLATQRR